MAWGQRGCTSRGGGDVKMQVNVSLPGLAEGWGQLDARG